MQLSVCECVLSASCLQGLVRSIGVSNFSVKKLAAILSYADIPPAVCQVCWQCNLNCLPPTVFCILLSAKEAYALE